MERSDARSARRELTERSSHPVAPILNPGNLLGESLRHLSPAQQANLVELAAGEALRLQAKREESQLDIAITSSKMDQAVRLARNLNKERMVGYRIETEHAGTSLTIQRGCFAQVLLFLIPMVGSIVVLARSNLF